MPDNTPFHASLDPAAPKTADLEVLHSGEQAKVQIITLAEVTGSEGAYTLRRLAALDLAATATAVASGTADAQVIAATPSLRLLGYTVKENAATPSEAEVILRHGTTASDTPLAHINLGPNESVRDWFGPAGIIASSGLFVDRVSGTTEITVFTVVS